MAILRKVDKPHVCRTAHLKADTTLYIGSVWQCDECKAVHVLVDLSPGRAIWQKSLTTLDDDYTFEDVEHIAEREIRIYGLEEDNLYTKADDDG